MKKLIFIIITLFLSTTFYAQQAIRINQLGYLPLSKKVAVYISRENTNIKTFALHNALTNAKIAELNTLTDFGVWKPFHACYRLDFSAIDQLGAYYLVANGIKSPPFRIANDVYDGSADFLLRYMRQQQCGYNPVLRDSCHKYDGYRIYHPANDSAHVDARGGWHDASDYLQYVATSANAVFHLLFAYQQNPSSFTDFYNAMGDKGSNGIPDVLDQAKWGLDWLVRMNPAKGEMYNQLADDRDHLGFRLPNLDSVSYGKGLERPVYLCTGKPQGVGKYQNRATGIASTAEVYLPAVEAITVARFWYLPTPCGLPVHK